MKDVVFITYSLLYIVPSVVSLCVFVSVLSLVHM